MCFRSKCLLSCSSRSRYHSFFLKAVSFLHVELEIQLNHCTGKLHFIHLCLCVIHVSVIWTKTIEIHTFEFVLMGVILRYLLFMEESQGILSKNISLLLLINQTTVTVRLFYNEPLTTFKPFKWFPNKFLNI